jgi:internalin A
MAKELVQRERENFEPNKRFISLMDYKHICDEEGVISEYAQNVLVDFLHDLGIIVHFKDYQLLDTHVLDPRWVMEGVYRIINSRELTNSKGLLRLNGLQDILGRTNEELRRYPADKHMYLIELMLKFELCYWVGDFALLIPDLLDVQEPQLSFDYRNALLFVFEYGYLPRSVIPRFIVRVSKDIVGENRWRTGVALHSALFPADALVRLTRRRKGLPSP